MTPLCYALILFSLPLLAQVNVLTYHNDNARTGQNLGETALKVSNVNAMQFGKLFSYPLNGWVYAQPLFMSGVNISGKGKRDVVFVATEHDSLYALDANSPAAPLWQASFINPAAGVNSFPSDSLPCANIYPEMGISGTPVIDAVTGTIYAVAMTLETSGGSAAAVQRLHALDITTGAERPGSPVVIRASVPGTGDGGDTVSFIPRNYKNRPGLLLVGGVVYTAWSSHCDQNVYHGWLIGYDAHTLNQVVVYNATPNGSAGSFWNGGAAPSADADANIFIVSGNGTFDADTGGSDLGESFLKLAFHNKTITVTDYFTPFNQADLNLQDLDTGSSGALLLPDAAGSEPHRHLLVSGSKEGKIYLLDRDNLGHFQPGNDSQIVQSLPTAAQPVFGVPAYFNQTVYFSGQKDNLKAFPISSAHLAESPSSRAANPFDYPGSVPSISANGSADGIVWTIDSSATLRAYEAANLSNELYNSNQIPERDNLDSYVLFSTPTIANGRVFVATQTALNVFGLSPVIGGTVAGIVNAASFRPGPVAPGSVIALFGTKMAQSTASAASVPLPATLGGASVTINGVTAPLFYASSSQINAQVPHETPLGNTVPLVVSVGGFALPSSSLQVQSAAPGLFYHGQNQAALLNADGSVNGPNHPAPTGSIVSVYLTGQGSVNNPPADGSPASDSSSTVILPVTASLGGQSAAVSFAGLAPTLVSVFQVNLRIPMLPSGTYQLVISVGGVLSNSASVVVSVN